LRLFHGLLCVNMIPGVHLVLRIFFLPQPHARSSVRLSRPLPPSAFYFLRLCSGSYDSSFCLRVTSAAVFEGFIWWPPPLVSIAVLSIRLFYSKHPYGQFGTSLNSVFPCRTSFLIGLLSLRLRFLWSRWPLGLASMRLNSSCVLGTLFDYLLWFRPLVFV